MHVQIYYIIIIAAFCYFTHGLKNNSGGKRLSQMHMVKKSNHDRTVSLEVPIPRLPLPLVDGRHAKRYCNLLDFFPFLLTEIKEQSGKRKADAVMSQLASCELTYLRSIIR